MNARCRWLGLITAAALLRAVTMSGQSPQALSGQEQRGRDIYFGAASGIKAVVGVPPSDAPPTLLACVNCHGRDGTGKPEGQVVPSDITWNALTKPYGVTHASGRHHSPYTERLLVRAVCMGLDPSGHPLHNAMPRFQMSQEDIAALTLYLKRLGSDNDTGIDDSTIRISTIVPSAGPFAAAGEAVRALLAGYFDTINKRGGIYNRRLDLSTLMLDETDPRTRVEEFMADKRPFLIVGGVTTDADSHIANVADTSRILFMASQGMPFMSRSAGNDHVFYLLSGVEQQARALIDYATERAHPAGSMAIVYSTRIAPLSVVSAIQAHGTRAGWSVMKAFDTDGEGITPETLAGKLSASLATHVLLLADSRTIGELAAAMTRAGSTQAVLVPGSIATDDLLTAPGALANRLFLAMPSLPTDQTTAGRAEYRALADEYGLPADHMAAQMAALGSAKVLTHALQLTGRVLSREKVVAVLESLYDFDTGLTPKVAFNANRRIGASGAYIVTVDPTGKQFKQLTGWIGVE